MSYCNLVVVISIPESGRKSCNVQQELTVTAITGIHNTIINRYSISVWFRFFRLMNSSVYLLLKYNVFFLNKFLYLNSLFILNNKIAVNHVYCSFQVYF